MDEVTRKQEWKLVYQDLEIPTMSTSASYNTRTNYKKYLYLYELEMCDWGDERPEGAEPPKFKVGDYVRIDSNEGRVVALTSRATILITLDGLNLQLPNALVFKSVLTNFTRNPRRRFDFTTVIDTRSSWNSAMDIGIAAIRGVDGVLDDPAPTALIKEISNDGATMQYFGWIDQRDNDLAKTRSEAMRQVRRTLRKAGILPPAPVQSIRLVRVESDDIDAAAREIHQPRDTSADRTLDASVQDAHSAQDGHNLLDSKAAE